MMRRSCTALAAIVAALASAGAAGPAGGRASWTPAQDLGPVGGETFSNTALASNDRGDAVAVLSTSAGIFVRRASAGQAFSAPRRIAASGFRPEGRDRLTRCRARRVLLRRRDRTSRPTCATTTAAPACGSASGSRGARRRDRAPCAPAAARPSSVRSAPRADIAASSSRARSSATTPGTTCGSCPCASTGASRRRGRSRAATGRR